MQAARKGITRMSSESSNLATLVTPQWLEANSGEGNVRLIEIAGMSQDDM